MANLLHRYDIKYFYKLNIETLIEIILSLNEDEFRNLVIPVFKKSKSKYAFERKYIYFETDNFLKFLCELLREDSLYTYRSLFKFLIIIIGVNYEILNIFVEYLRKEPDAAINILFEFSKSNLKVLNTNVQKVINDVLSKHKELNLPEYINKKLKLVYDKSIKDFNHRGL